MTRDAGLRDAGQALVSQSRVLKSRVIKQRRVSYSYRTATTSYPCYIPVLGDFRGSWSYKTYPMQKYGLFLDWQAKNENFYSCP